MLRRRRHAVTVRHDRRAVHVILAVVEVGLVVEEMVVVVVVGQGVDGGHWGRRGTYEPAVHPGRHAGGRGQGREADGRRPGVGEPAEQGVEAVDALGGVEAAAVSAAANCEQISRTKVKKIKLND